VRVPRRLQELSLRIEQCRTELGQELGRAPTPAEIADRAEVTEEEVLEGMEAASLYRIGSLDAPVRGGDEATLEADRVGGEDDELVGAEDRLLVRELIARLPVRERRIVYLRYFEGLTQTEIADRVGISQMHVSRLLTRSLEALGAEVDAVSSGGSDP